MIDTIVLSLSADQIKIRDYDVFSPSARGLFEPPYYKLGARAHFQCVLNPCKGQEYAPRLTLSKRCRAGGFSVALKIELSLPKLVFGNNFDELDDCDFYDVIVSLQERLTVMGIIVDLGVLANASVTGVHYGKNILLTGRTTSSAVIKILAKLNISKRLDAGNTDFRNEGHAIRFHANNYELSFYDKVKDLAQAKTSEARAIERDNAVQLDLFTGALKPPDTEVLRIECRLNNRKKIKYMLERCLIKGREMVFKDLYSKDVSTAVLKYFWDVSVLPSLDVVLLSEQDIESLFLQLRVRGIKEMDALKCCGALMFVKACGMRGFRQNLSAKGNTFGRINKILNTIDFDKGYMYGCFQFIQRTIYENQRLQFVAVQGDKNDTNI